MPQLATSACSSGNFVTKEDLDRQYERVKSYSFNDA